MKRQVDASHPEGVFSPDTDGAGAASLLQQIRWRLTEDLALFHQYLLQRPCCGFHYIKQQMQHSSSTAPGASEESTARSQPPLSVCSVT